MDRISRERRARAADGEAVTRPAPPSVGRRAPTFVAIDFETADYGADSACAIGVVRVSGGSVERKERRLIRPPRSRFAFTGIHGIAWEHVRAERPFGEVWSELAPMLEGADFLAAHNAPFDRKVLESCCAAAGIAPPPQRFVCTVRLARKLWNLPRASLPHVARFLGLRLDHHEPLSDAEACARIVIAAVEDGAEV